MNGRKVFSNEKKLLSRACLGVAAWTCCCVLLTLYGFAEIDVEKQKPFDLLNPVNPFTRVRSKSEVFWLGLVVWGGGTGLIGGGFMLFWKARYSIEYEASVIEVAHSWPRKQLFVDGELQDENADFAFTRVELRGRIKSGEATDKQIRVSFASFGSLTPICVVIDDSVVFKG